MRINQITRETALRLGIKQWHVLMLGMSIALNLILGGLLVAKGNNHRETLVPPVIQKSFWVEDGKVSNEYLVEMAVFLAQLYFDVTPSNVDFNHQHLKRYVHPRYYGVLEQSAGGYAQILKRDNSSTHFSVTTIKPDEEASEIALSGTLTTYVGDRRVAQKHKTFTMAFGFDGGRVLLTSIKETNDKDPFGDSPAE